MTNTPPGQTEITLANVDLYRLLGSVAPFAAAIPERPELDRVRLSLNVFNDFTDDSSRQPIRALRSYATDRLMLGLYRHPLDAEDLERHGSNFDISVRSSDVAAILKLLKAAGGSRMKGTSRLTVDGTGMLIVDTLGFGEHICDYNAPITPLPAYALASILARPATADMLAIDPALFARVLKAAAAVNIDVAAKNVGEPLVWWAGEKAFKPSGFMVGDRLVGAIMPYGLPSADSRREAWSALLNEPGWPA